MNGIRLQLLLAKAGVASRRRAEELIVARRVAVNGRTVSELGTKVDPVQDRVTVDGKPVEREAPAYYLINKPKGYVTTASDPEGRATVFELLPKTLVRLFSVGRLDYNTEGALLLTNDGELAHALMHPSRGVPKVYHAKLRGLVSADQVRRLRDGVVLPPARPPDREGRLAPLPSRKGPGGSETPERSAPAQVDVLTSTGKHSWLQVVLHEGKNRQIHRMAEAVGSSLLKLMRVAYAGLELGDLPAGSYRPLRPREVIALRQGVGLPGRLPGSAEEETPPRARPARAPTRGTEDRPMRSATRGTEDRPMRSATRGTEDRPMRSATRGTEDRPMRSATRGTEDRPMRSATRGTEDRPMRSATRGTEDRPMRSVSRAAEDRPMRSATRGTEDRPMRSPSRASDEGSGPTRGQRPGPMRGPVREDDRPRSAPARNPQRDRDTGWALDREPAERRGPQRPERDGAPKRERPERPAPRWDDPPRRAPSGAGRSAPESRGASRGASRPQPRPQQAPRSRPYPRHDDDRPAR